MKFSIQTVVAVVLSSSPIAVVAAGEASIPSHHPNVDLLHKFSPHFRCPYANEWISKGPVQASINLGLWNATTTTHASSSKKKKNNNVRRAQEETVSGSCVYTNIWTGQPACLEMRGDSWTSETMQTRCAAEPDGTLTEGSACEVPPAGMAGWCIVEADNGVEASPLPLAGLGCGTMKMTCESRLGGTFEALQTCAGEEPATSGMPDGGGPASYPGAGSMPSGAGGAKCAIAPGAIGAAHQAGYASGYGSDCEGTPAEGSPYMWPTAWSADVVFESMAFGSDDVLFTSKGSVHYRLDKNWKRQDWWYTRGVQRSLGQPPCEPENKLDGENDMFSCRRNSDDHTTMIHRGGKMVFLTWKNDTNLTGGVPTDPSQIDKCQFLDLAIVGNIRPDWYMDDRGEDTDVQYLGDQHVYHNDIPRLVKQWRKKDFASQYFTMSMLGNPKEDGVHWPMILNVPGEGFGDDFLQKYTNHSLLPDDSDDLFLLDEALVAMGGECTQRTFDAEDVDGPPTDERVHVPSNLEVDENAWFTNVYTFSPVWEPPMKTVDDDDDAKMTASGKAITEQGKLIVSTCYDDTEKVVDVSVEFLDVVSEDTPDMELPWMALAYRKSEECRMTPSDGSDAELILLTVDEASVGSETKAFFSSLPAAARGFNTKAIGSISDNRIPLEDKEGFSNVELVLPFSSLTSSSTSTSASRTRSTDDDMRTATNSVMVHFKQSMEEAPEAMYLNYAIGASPEIGFHSSRECVDITKFPLCSTTDNEMDSASANANASAAVSSYVGSVIRGIFLAMTAFVAVSVL